MLDYADAYSKSKPYSLFTYYSCITYAYPSARICMRTCRQWRHCDGAKLPLVVARTCRHAPVDQPGGRKGRDVPPNKSPDSTCHMKP
eukprot:SAG22_NODE_226_length_14668_cov_29.647495_5_plen_87_part_00